MIRQDAEHAPTLPSRGRIVFAVNLMPAFGPPTWAVLVLLN